MLYVDELEEKLRIAEECLKTQIRKCDEVVYQRDEATRRAAKLADALEDAAMRWPGAEWPDLLSAEERQWLEGWRVLLKTAD